jgi:hypothetical protein
MTSTPWLDQAGLVTLPTGRTGTAPAAHAVLDGLPADRAVGWVRENYHHRAVETPWQRWWLRAVR